MFSKPNLRLQGCKKPWRCWRLGGLSANALRCAKSDSAHRDHDNEQRKGYFRIFYHFGAYPELRLFIGDIDNVAHHHSYELFAAIVVNLIATVLKFGDRTHLGAVLLATSLVADLQLLGAATVWAVALYGSAAGLTEGTVVSIVSLSGGALLANIVSVVLLVAETMAVRR